MVRNSCAVRLSSGFSGEEVERTVAPPRTSWARSASSPVRV